MNRREILRCSDKKLAEKMPYVKAHLAVLYDSSLSTRARLLYLLLDSRCINSSQCYPSQQTLCENLGVRDRKVIKAATDALIDRGLVETEVVKDNRGVKIIYTVHHPADVYKDDDQWSAKKLLANDKFVVGVRGKSPEGYGENPRRGPGIIPGEEDINRKRLNRSTSAEGASRLQSIADEEEDWEEEESEDDILLFGEDWEEEDDDLEEDLSESPSEELPATTTFAKQGRLYGAKGRDAITRRAKRVVSSNRPHNEAVEEVWTTYTKHIGCKWEDAVPPNKLSGREAGQIKNTLLNEYDLTTVLRMVRLIVWDWEAIQGEWRAAYKTGRIPTINNLVSMRRDLAGALETGVTSQQRRVSQYKKRFLKKTTNGGAITWND